MTPAQMVTAIGNISGGGNGDYAKYADSISFFNSALPENVNIDFIKSVLMKQTFRGTRGCKNITISMPSAVSYYLAFYSSSVESVDVTNSPFGGDSQGAFWACSALKTIIGLNLNSVTNVVNMFSGASNLETIEIVPNTCRMSISYSDCNKLTDASLVNIANSLVSGAYTLTLHSTPKNRCASILGTVSSVTDGTGTYDFFTADANGAVTLTDFITNTKGWTVA